MAEIFSKKSGKEILLGNEAIIRGALESGVQFVSTYPGTPASEVGNVFYKIANDFGVYFEFSTNEKVAMEAAIGASFSGLKTLVAMKNFGLNVALDALMPFVYTGSKGPTVIIIADDPSCHSSAQSEENTRGILLAARIPVLEPSTPQECKDFMKLGYQISEKFSIPVVIRTTTRVAHQKAQVVLGEIKKPELTKIGFVRDAKKFITMPPRVFEMKKEVMEKMEKIKSLSEKNAVNKIIKGQKPGIGIITSGASYLNVLEALNELKVSLPVFKIGFFNPLPEDKIKEFIKPLKRVLVVEELEPFLEDDVKRLAKEANCKLEIFGKDLITEIGEMKPEYVIYALAKILNRKYDLKTANQTINAKRAPQLCPGCPYWLVISAIKKAVNTKEVVFGGEIGCYMLFGGKAINLQDYLMCMGSSISIAHGIKKAAGQKIITFIGDSSFFHSGIPALINTVFNKSNPLVIILNNETTAMTGHQPHPVSVGTNTGISIENLVRACGVKYVKTLDPVNQQEFTDTVKDFLEKDSVSVIISKHPCKFAVNK
jgi:indolepyruvate ferredoxin oxidoreductase, alpha subunit